MRTNNGVLTTMTTDPLTATPLESIEAVRVGCATWSIPPARAVQFAGGGSHLQRYSQVLNCSEINSSFRRVHRAATWQRWASSVPPDFRFSVKMSRAITHDAKLECPSEVVMEFVQQIQFLNGRLGPLLLQTPPSLEFESKYVSNFFSLLRKRYRGDVVCEPRHSSWFTEERTNAFRIFWWPAWPQIRLACRRPQIRAASERWLTFGSTDLLGPTILAMKKNL
jgi:hypothetical protein